MDGTLYLAKSKVHAAHAGSLQFPMAAKSGSTGLNPCSNTKAAKLGEKPLRICRKLTKKFSNNLSVNSKIMPRFESVPGSRDPGSHLGLE